MHENPWAYNEARNRIREEKEREKVVIEKQTETFEKSKETIKKGRKLDVFSLKNRIETGHSLSVLKSELRDAFQEGIISRDALDSMIDVLENSEKSREDSSLNMSQFPFFQNQLAKLLERQRIGENIPLDIVGFLYGFFVQGSAILVILAWRILMDLLRLPVDVYYEIKK